jgi:hypothetical protein
VWHGERDTIEDRVAAEALGQPAQYDRRHISSLAAMPLCRDPLIAAIRR